MATDLACEAAGLVQFEARPGTLLRLAAACLGAVHWWWPLDGVTVLCEWPRRARLERQDRVEAPFAPFEGALMVRRGPRPRVRSLRLHAIDGPALQYRDGISWHAIHGVGVRRGLIRELPSLTPGRVLAEPNAEVRRVLIDLMGLERLLDETGARVLDRDRDAADQPRRLLGLEIPHDREGAIVAVEVACPSTGRRYLLRVPPDTGTCTEAVAWTWGLRPEEYRPAAET